jgi:hypothetical protein
MTIPHPQAAQTLRLDAYIAAASIGVGMTRSIELVALRGYADQAAGILHAEVDRLTIAITF